MRQGVEGRVHDKPYTHLVYVLGPEAITADKSIKSGSWPVMKTEPAIAETPYVPTSDNAIKNIINLRIPSPPYFTEYYNILKAYFMPIN